MTVRARLTRRCVPLFSEFGLEYATKLFGEQAIADLPRYQRGPKRGQIKAWLVWEKAESGGWDARYGVCRPGLVHAHISGVYDGQMPLRGTWMGRVQDLSGQRGVLSAEYREQNTLTVGG